MASISPLVLQGHIRCSLSCATMLCTPLFQPTVVRARCAHGAHAVVPSLDAPPPSPARSPSVLHLEAGLPPSL